MTAASSPKTFLLARPTAVGETGGRHDSFPAYAFAVGYTHVFNPSLTNEMHVGMVHADKLQGVCLRKYFGIPANYGIQGIPQLPNNGGLPPTPSRLPRAYYLTHIGVGNLTQLCNMCGALKARTASPRSIATTLSRLASRLTILKATSPSHRKGVAI